MAPLLALRSRTSAGFLGTLLLGVLGGCAVQPEPEPLVYPPAMLDSTRIHSARTLLAAARTERAADNMPAAERLLTGLLEVHPYYAGAYEELVSLQLEVGNLSRAREALDEGLALDPGNRNLKRLDGAYFLAQGDLDQALERYSALAESDKLDAKAQLNLALVQVMRGEDLEALATLAVPLGPDRAKQRLAVLQKLREQSSQVPEWAPREMPEVEVEPEAPQPSGRELLAEGPEPEVEPQPLDPQPEAAEVAAANEALEQMEAALDGEAEAEEVPLIALVDPEDMTAAGDMSAAEGESPEAEPMVDEEGGDSGEELAVQPEEEPVVIAEPEVPAEEVAPEEDPGAALAQEPLELEPIELGDPSTAPLGTAKLDAPPVVAPVAPVEESEEEAVVLAVPEEPEPEPEIPAAPFVSSEWRGLAKSKIDAFGVLAIQDQSGVEVQMLPDGQHIVSNDRYASGPIWVMGPKSDWLLSPNARVRFLKDGSVFAGSGDREEFPAPAGRAPAEDVWR